MTPKQKAAVREAVARQSYERDFWGETAPKWTEMSEIQRSPWLRRADEQCAAHIAALEAAGYCIAPVEPTDAMIESGSNAFEYEYVWDIKELPSEAGWELVPSIDFPHLYAVGGYVCYDNTFLWRRPLSHQSPPKKPDAPPRERDRTLGPPPEAEAPSLQGALS